jgi:WD40 repeat protein
MVPTDHPFKALARALMPFLEPTLDEIDRLAKTVKLAEHFQSGTVSLHDIVERILEKQPGTDRLLIVVDQFEELYTLTSDEKTRRRFLDEILAASSCSGTKATLALTLRGDFVGQVLANRPLSDQLQDAQINLGPMNREELECAICKPAEKIGLKFESGLIRRIINDVGGEPGNLPLLEFVLKELWEKRRGGVLLNETYDAIGGVQGAVATKADELFKALSSAEQKTLRRVFLRIVRPTENGLDTRRRAAFSELPPEAEELVVKLAKERLLVTDQSASDLERTVEVAHEALISNWSTLRAWVNEDREFLLWRERLRALLAEWERAKESEEALLRGPLLIEAQKWLDQRSQDLSDQERKFISAGREERERLAREKQERYERELETTRKLVEEQRLRAQLSEDAGEALRRRAWIAGGLGSLALVVGLFLIGATLESRSMREFFWRVQERAITAVGISPDNRYVVTGSQDGRVQLWDLKATVQEANSMPMRLSSDDTIRAVGSSDDIRAVGLSPDNRWLIVANMRFPSREVRIFDLTPGRGTSGFGDDDERSILISLFSPQGDDDARSIVEISPDGHWLLNASYGYDRPVWLWDLTAKNPAAEPLRLDAQDNEKAPDAMKVLLDSDQLSRDPDRLLSDADRLLSNPIRTHYGRHHDDIYTLYEGGWHSAAGVSPDSHWLITGKSDGTARLYDLRTKDRATKPVVLRGHEAGICAVAVSSDSRWLVTGSEDKTARLWDLNAKDPAANPVVLRGHQEAVFAVAMSPDSRWVVTGSVDKTVRLWDLSAKDPAADPVILRGYEHTVRRVAISPDNHWLVTGNYAEPSQFLLDPTYVYRLWDLRARDLAGSPIVLPELHYAMAISRDSHWLVTGCKDGTIRFWDLRAKDPAADPVVLRGRQN